MIVGTGVDLVEVERVGQLLDRYGDHFRGRIFTQDEVRYCERFRYKAERYAARFAAKEAAFKALGTGWRVGVRWVDVEVVRRPGSRPGLQLFGRASEVAAELRVDRIALSLSHVHHYAVAQVIFESNGFG